MKKFSVINIRTLLLSTFLLTAAASFCQNTDWQEALRQWAAAEEAEDYGPEMTEALQERAENPINLNKATAEELEELPFLTEQQIDDILEYVYRYGPVRSLSELLMIASLDWDTRRLLQCFVVAGDREPQRRWPTLRQLADYGKSTLMATAKIPLYDRRGYTANTRNAYIGYKYRHDLRYQFNYNDRIKIGITGAQDAGEPFLSNCNRWGYDHYNYYLQLRNFGALEALNAGTYRVQMGMGLIMNSGFSLGKTATLLSLGRSSHTLSASTGRSQANVLRGAAATVRLSTQLSLTAFASLRSIDATLNKDGDAQTLLTDGYHRTATEIGKKGNTQQTDIGASIGWRKRALRINANIVCSHLDRKLAPQKATQLYRRYAAEGNSFTNASLDYSLRTAKLSIAGETAISGSGAFALLHTVNCRLSPKLTMMALYRYYDRRYTALMANAFAEGSGVQNEHGLYAGLRWQPSDRWQLQAYADYAHFSWPRYQVSAASDAVDLMASARYRQKTWNIEGRYRMHLRQRDNSSKTNLENMPEHRLRLRLSADVSPTLKAGLQADAVSTLTKTDSQQGIMIACQASLKKKWLKADASAGWFHTDGYDSRIYQYEQSVAHDFAFASYYGHGLRYQLTCSADITHNWQLAAKAGVTNYFDRSTISSGMQQIGHSSMADILLQIKVMF